MINSKNMQSTFNERFLKLLKAKDIKPASLAKMMGVSRQVVDNYLGSTLPGFLHLVKILEAFPDVNLRWLIFGEGDAGIEDLDLIEMFREDQKNMCAETLMMLWNDDRKEVQRLRFQNNKLINKILEYEEKSDDFKKISNLNTDNQQIAEA